MAGHDGIVVLFEGRGGRSDKDANRRRAKGGGLDVVRQIVRSGAWRENPRFPCQYLSDGLGSLSANFFILKQLLKLVPGEDAFLHAILDVGDREHDVISRLD